jgi:hypothetical protein
MRRDHPRPYTFRRRMSSRQEEKARRKAEREALEAEQAAKVANSRRLQIVGGVVLALAAIAAVVVVVTSSGGGGKSGAAGPVDKVAGVKLPAVKETDLNKAAAAAGCKLLNPAMEGREHVTTPVTYKNSNPPASGNHNPTWAEAGNYAPGNEPTKEHWVHSLEHGRVEIQYRPGTSKTIRDQLETLGAEPFNGSPGYQIMVFENNTQMPYAVAAVAWTHVLGCKTMNTSVFDAIRAFRKTYTDKAPELIP